MLFEIPDVIFFMWIKIRHAGSKSQISGKNNTKVMTKPAEFLFFNK